MEKNGKGGDVVGVEREGEENCSICGANPVEEEELIEIREGDYICKTCLEVIQNKEF